MSDSTDYKHRVSSIALCRRCRICFCIYRFPDRLVFEMYTRKGKHFESSCFQTSINFAPHTNLPLPNRGKSSKFGPSEFCGRAPIALLYGAFCLMVYSGGTLSLLASLDCLVALVDVGLLSMRSWIGFRGRAKRFWVFLLAISSARTL